MRKFGLWLALLGSMVCAMVLAGCTSKQKSLSDEEAYKRFVGTWVNSDYPGTLERSQITVIRPDHVGEDWLFQNSMGLAGSWTIMVKKTWVDEKGDTHCQFFYRDVANPTHIAADLMRVDKTGKIGEICAQWTATEITAAYPEKIDPDIQNYWIYYRKK